MNRILELREKRAKAWDAAKKFLDAKTGPDGLVSAEDSATYDKMEADVLALGKEVERLERQAAIDAALNAPANQPITEKPGEKEKAKAGRASAEYAAAFWQAIRSKSVPHEVFNALETGTDSEGGYLVPDEYQRTLIDALQEQNIFRQLAHVITTTSGERKIPVVASHGTAAWIDEEGSYPESDDAFGQVSIGSYKLATMIKVSEELLNDSAFDVPAYIAREFARRIGAAEEEAFFTGNGTGKPLGILAATGGAQTGVTAASATAITMDEVMDLFYSLRVPYRRNSVFIMNDSTKRRGLISMKKRVLVVILCLSLVLGSVAHAAVEFSSFKMTFSNKDTYQKITSDTTSKDNPTRARLYITSNTSDVNSVFRAGKTMTGSAVTRLYYDRVTSGRMMSYNVIIAKDTAYIIDEKVSRFGARWMTEGQIESIRAWENKNKLDSTLSENYSSCIELFIHDKFVYESDWTSYGNPKEYALYPSLKKLLFDCPQPLLECIERIKQEYKFELPF